MRGKYITNAPNARNRAWRTRKGGISIGNRQQEVRQPDLVTERNVKNSTLYRELSTYQAQGVELWLNGRRSTSYQIANSVREATNYMRDYQMDVQNRICGIGFDRIRNEKPRDTQDFTQKNGGAKPLVRKS